MNFVHPQLLWMAPLALLFLMGASFCAAWRRKKMLEQLLGHSPKTPGAVHCSPEKRKLRVVLYAGVLLLLIVAAARPYRSSRIIPRQTFGRDILVLFDVSKSMWATDVAPSRLDHAKYLLREVVEKTENDRFGIVAFAGRAFLSCPLTSDRTTLEQYIQELGPSAVPVGGTNLELPINIALDAFEAAAGARAILLITDGDELSGNSAGAIAKLRERRIPLFIFGLGDPRIASPVPDEGGGFKRTAQGELATSRLNEEKLREFAKETEGVYVRSTVTSTGIAPILRRIDQLGKAKQDLAEKSIPYDDFPLLLGIALVLLFLYLMIGERPLERRGAWVLFWAMPLLLNGATPEELYNTARASQLAGGKDAVSLYEQAIREGRDNREVRSRALYNLGVASHRGAEEALSGALESVKAQQMEQAMEKLENAAARLREAEELYRQSLASSSGLPDNLARLASDRSRVETLKKKIEELKKQKEEAKQQIEQARDRNRQEANRKDSQKSSNRETPMEKQPQERSQNSEEDLQLRSDADSAIEQAMRKTEQLKKQADELNQTRLSQHAGKARQELEKAEQERQNHRREQAQNHLDEAARIFSADSKDQEREMRESQPPEEQQLSQKQREQKEASGEGGGEPSPKKAPVEQAERAIEREERGEISQEVADQLFRMMKEEEQSLRDRVNRGRAAREYKVEKDW